MSAPTMAPILVSRRQAAEMLGVRPITIKRMARRGELREVKIHPSAHPRLLVSDINALIARNGLL